MYPADDMIGLGHAFMTAIRGRISKRVGRALGLAVYLLLNALSSGGAGEHEPNAAKVTHLLKDYEQVMGLTGEKLRDLRGDSENLSAIHKEFAKRPAKDKEKLLDIASLLGAHSERDAALKRITWTMRVREKTAVLILVDALRDKDTDVRNKASRLLSRAVPSSSLRAFALQIVETTKVTSHSDEILVLGRTDSFFAQKLLETEPRFKRANETQFKMALARLGNQEYERGFVKQFKDCKRPEEKAALATRLGYIASPPAIIALASELRSPEKCSWLGAGKQSLRVPIIMALSDAMPEHAVLWRPDDSAPVKDSYYESVEQWASKSLGTSWRTARPPFFFRGAAPTRPVPLGGASRQMRFVSLAEESSR